MFDLKLENKVVLVTGSTRGLGKTIAEKFAQEKAIVIITGTNQDKAMAVAETINKVSGGVVEGYKLDVSDEVSVKHIVSEVIKKYGKIDILINNAGITRDARLMMMKTADWAAVLNTNLTGTFNCIKYVSKQMLKQRCGSIINMASVVGIMGNIGQANYSASKAGIIGLTKTAAKELAARGINVNAIAPGYIKSDMTNVLEEEVSKKMLSLIPMGEYGTSDDVANMALFLASNKAKYVTGQVINVDGGMLM